MRYLVSLVACCALAGTARAHDDSRFAPVMPYAGPSSGCFGQPPQTFAAPAGCFGQPPQTFAAPSSGCFGYAPSRQVIRVPTRRQRVIEEEVIEEYEIEQPPPVVRRLPPRSVRYTFEDCCDGATSFSSRTSVSVDAFRSGHSRRGSRVAVDVGARRGILGKLLGGRRGGSSRVSVRVRN
jgi:hypothetical protein